MKYRKKPVTVEAIRWMGDNAPEVDLFVFDHENRYWDDDNKLIIKTLEGEMIAELGDWIIKGIKGEFYPCKNDVFEQTYEEIE